MDTNPAGGTKKNKNLLTNLTCMNSLRVQNKNETRNNMTTKHTELSGKLEDLRDRLREVENSLGFGEDSVRMGLNYRDRVSLAESLRSDIEDCYLHLRWEREEAEDERIAMGCHFCQMDEDGQHEEWCEDYLG